MIDAFLCGLFAAAGVLLEPWIDRKILRPWRVSKRRKEFAAIGRDWDAETQRAVTVSGDS